MLRMFGLVFAAACMWGQNPSAPDWRAVDEEGMRHYQALLRINTSDPPGVELPAVEYLKRVLEAEGIPARIFALDPKRPNLVARLKGSGGKRPLLIMGHTDVVNVDPGKWTFPPFGAVRNSGYVYGRGTLDDKDNLTACLMVMLTLKRMKTPLDRDVIFLAEAGEEGSVKYGILHMVPRFLDQLRKVISDPAVEVVREARDTRPLAPPSRLDSEACQVIEAAVKQDYAGAITLPVMQTGATDMAYLRAKGVQCYGVGPATDFEDGPKGFGAHSDQERILETEFYRFLRFHWNIATALAAAKP
ncbi:MAG: M20/M25/M40 family metallo-hydrolase [Bryobacterales bacterium]|nr:M20/M25/M40 family metallo-hydrolase [Bryobacterales bacterium]